MNFERYSRRITVLLLFIGILLQSVFQGSAEAAVQTGFADDEQAVLYYFWGYCPVCSKPEEHVGLFEDYPVRVEIYEVFHYPEGREVYDQKSSELGIEIYGFPTLVYQDQYWLGFSENTQKEIIESITADLSGDTTTVTGTRINLPLYGEVNLLETPLLLTTMIIAILDGFNPCSLFVLTFLLAIIVHSASRKKILLVGLTFLMVTSAVYGLFMLGVLNIMIFAGQLFWVRNLVAALVIILGLAGIKDYLISADGLTFAIPESYKQKYYGQVRRIFYTESIFPAVLATAVMALGISLIELPCTAGFPFIWSSIISGMELPFYYFILLFALYIFLYLLIEIIIFMIAVIRMRSIKMTEEKGRLLKLIAGSLMMVLGLILLVKPEYMENIVGLIITFGSALALIGLLIGLKKTIKYFKGEDD